MKQKILTLVMLLLLAAGCENNNSTSPNNQEITMFQVNIENVAQIGRAHV